MTDAETKEKVLQAIKNMKNDDLALAYFDFCRFTGYEPVYSMDEIDDIFCDMPPLEFMRLVHDSYDFDPHQEYFYCDLFGHLESFSELSVENSPIGERADEMANFVVKEKNALYDPILTKILNGEE